MPASRMRSCQSRYHQLAERNKTLQAELANLTAHSKQLEGERNQSERELLSLDEHNHHLVENIRATDRGDTLPAALETQLSNLTQKHRALRYDERNGAIQIDPDVLFASGKSQLLPAAGEMLAQFGSLLREADENSIRVLIVAPQDFAAGANRVERSDIKLSVDRAVAVRDFFKSWGIPEDRLGISSYGPAQVATGRAEAGPAGTTRPVEVFLLSPQVPVVGWNEASAALYR